MTILRLLRTRPATVSQIAAELGVHPANLTRHFMILLGAGLISLRETRNTGRNLEKYYEAVAYDFVIEADGGGLEEPHAIALRFAASDLSAAIPALPPKEEATVYAMVKGARIPPNKLVALREAVDRLVQSFEAADADDGVPFHLNVSLYPAPLDEEREIRLRLGAKKENP
jgi:DNA-binding transcriptional ArsR family regulator